MRPLTGTHVYSYVKCPRLAALDLHLPRSARRSPTPWEEFAAQRGRAFEAQWVAALKIVAPEYPERDFTAGAIATRQLLTDGVPWIHQAVLMPDDRLGLPDLLRRLPGSSALGEHHYEVLDIKTSGQPRSDQILQVVFYSQMLAVVQGRMPEHGAVVLKDGREERFRLADYAAAADEVTASLRALRADLALARPFLQPGCAGCYHDQRCATELAAAQDLSLVQGMSHGARAILERVGCRTVAELAAFHPDHPRERGNLDATLLRRLRRAAQAHQQGQPMLELRPRAEPLQDAVLVHLLRDPYADRVLAFGRLQPAEPGGAVQIELPTSADDEGAALARLLAGLPSDSQLLHFGEALPAWYEQQVFQHEVEPLLEASFIDLLPRLRAAAVYPGPVFSLADFVRLGLGRDPWRAGHPSAAAMWLEEADGEQRLRAKLHADLEDLAALKQRFLDAVAMPGAPTGLAPA